MSDRLKRERTYGTFVINTWNITFTDLLTLLVAFFVLRLSMASVSDLTTNDVTLGQNTQEQLAVAEQFSGVVQALSGALAPPSEVGSSAQIFQASDKVSVETKPTGMKISFHGANFSSGSDELIRSTEAERALEKIASLVATKGYFVRVEGHTDSEPISSSIFPSNWELSTARAIAVARELTRLGVPGAQIAAAGYADSHPIADNQTETGRQQNRRVEVSLSPRS